VNTQILRTHADVRPLSYYTLCKLSDALSCVYPQHFIPRQIELGHMTGVELTTDDLGNFILCTVLAD
jgi:hypothetical protein